MFGILRLSFTEVCDKTIYNKIVSVPNLKVYRGKFCRS